MLLLPMFVTPEAMSRPPALAKFSFLLQDIL
jgi:hypothetical protein